MAFSDFKISTKLSMGFSLMMLIIISMGFFAWGTMLKFSAEWENYQAVASLRKDAISSSFKFLSEGGQNFKNYIIRGGDYNQEFMRDMEALEAMLEEYKNAGELPPEEAEILVKVKKGIDNYRNLMKFVITDMKKQGSSINDIDKLAWNADKPLMEALNNLLKINDTRSQDTTLRIRNLLEYFNYLAVAVILISIVITGAASYLLSRSITLPLKKSVEVANLVADGDLTSEIVPRSDDETGQLMNALKRMNESLAHIVGEVRSSTDSMAVASRELVTGNNDLSRRTEEQASSLDETSSSMEKFTITVKQNADHARQANELAASASSIAIKGGEVVGQAVNTMSLINESSKKIVDIISVIDSIAFQTNILALNAAVEAARAGEQGRGFAVVATEVRNLAQRSAVAAKEIKGLITDSVEEIDNGTQLVGEAGKTMQEIVGSIKKVSEIVSEIATASIEQKSGIEEVNKTVIQMEQVTQQNAALVEEAAAAAEALEEQAQHLAGIVRVFKLIPYQKLSSDERKNVPLLIEEKMNSFDSDYRNSLKVSNKHGN